MASRSSLRTAREREEAPNLLQEGAGVGGSGTSVGKHRGKLLAHPTELAVGESLRSRKGNNFEKVQKQASCAFQELCSNTEVSTHILKC